MNTLEDSTVFELVASIAPDSFGLGYAALNLAVALHSAGVDVYLGCVDSEKQARAACEEAGFPIERLVRGDVMGHQRFRFSHNLFKRLRNVSARKQVLVHSHGLWTYTSRVAIKLSESYKCPRVVSPHGSLEPYALSLSQRRKAVASFLYERKNLFGACCLWALSARERQSIREYGIKERTAVIENGVRRAVECAPGGTRAFRGKYGIEQKSRILLFLSRITPKKGLPLLLEAFARTAELKDTWTLVIAGSDEGGHIHEVRSLIESLGIGSSVRLVGPLFGEDKASAFSSASLFVLPSHSEGLPIAVLEAMEYGIPVLVTDGWALPCSTEKEFGWRVAADEVALRGALCEAMASTDERLRSLGRVGRDVIRENFTWDAVGQKAIGLYAELLANCRPIN